MLKFQQGIDIPDVYIIVQFRVPVSMSTWLQRTGRAVQDFMLQGTAILLAEPTMFDEAKVGVGQMAGISRSDPSEGIKATRTDPTASMSTIAGNKENLAPGHDQSTDHAASAGSYKRKASDILHPLSAPKRSRVIDTGTIKSGGTGTTKRRGNESLGKRTASKKKTYPSRRPAGSEEAMGVDVYGNSIKVERAMDDFINAGNQVQKCRRRIACIHFGNVGLGEPDPISLAVILSHAPSSTHYPAVLLSSLRAQSGHTLL